MGKKKAVHIRNEPLILQNVRDGAWSEALG